MPYRPVLTAVIFLSALLSFSCGSKEEGSGGAKTSVTIVDDLNAAVSFESAPKRVISLAPNLTEMIYTLGAESRLAGNTLYCNYPPQAQKVTKVGDMMTLDYERILALKPDLLFITVEGNQKDSYYKLKELGLRVFVSNPRNFAGIKKTFLDMGRIFNDTSKALQIIKGWDERYNEITSRAKEHPHPKGMFMVGLNPLMAAGKNTFINELITSAGLVNIAADSPLNYPIYSREEMLRRNPDYIITTDNSPDIYRKFLDSYPEWKGVKAIKERRVIVCDPDLYLRPGPRFAAALEDLFSKLHSPGS